MVLNANLLAKNITLHVKLVGVKRFTIKLWIARQLIKLAGMITGMNIKFETQPFDKADM